MEDVVKLPEHTTEDYDEVTYEDAPAGPPQNVADFLWKTINTYLHPDWDVQKHNSNLYYNIETGQKLSSQLCYARSAVFNFETQKLAIDLALYNRAQNHLFSLDTARKWNDNFNDCEDQQGARYIYGYLAYLVALDEGL